MYDFYICIFKCSMYSSEHFSDDNGQKNIHIRGPDLKILK